MQNNLEVQHSPDLLKAPSFAEVLEPQMVALVASGRGGTKIFQSYLDDHEQILMIPGFPLMYLYSHWATWSEEASDGLTWQRAIDLFCVKHGSVLDSRRVPGLTGLDGLGELGDEHAGVDEEQFRRHLEFMLDGVPVQRRTFLLAVHYAYGLCKGWELQSKPVLFFHLHYAPYLKELAEDFPDLKVVHMPRDIRSSLPSTVRALGIADQEKLTATDGLIYAGRNYWLAYRPLLETLDLMGGFLDRNKVTAIKLETFHHNLEPTMRNLALSLGINFSPSMLESTFDGKLWWGDVTNVARFNGLNPESAPDRWKESANKLETFVIEGISYQYFEAFRYQKSVYRRDSVLNRLLLILAVLVPSRTERSVWRSYFNPVAHLRFLRTALDESKGRLPRMDYTWNGTHRYKYTYIDLRLWRSRWHQRFLNFVENPPEDHWVGKVSRIIRPLSCVLYVGGQYARFCVSAIAYPREIFRRWRISYRSLRRRLSHTSFSPPLLD